MSYCIMQFIKAPIRTRLDLFYPFRFLCVPRVGYALRASFRLGKSKEIKLATSSHLPFVLRNWTHNFYQLATGRPNFS